MAEYRSKLNPPQEPPKELLQRPTLFYELTGIYNSFIELSDTREGFNRIKYGTVSDWLNEHNVFGEMRETLRRFFTVLDAEYLSIKLKEHKKNEPPKEQAKRKKRWR